MCAEQKRRSPRKRALFNNKRKMLNKKIVEMSLNLEHEPFNQPTSQQASQPIQSDNSDKETKCVCTTVDAAHRDSTQKRRRRKQNDYFIDFDDFQFNKQKL